MDQSMLEPGIFRHPRPKRSVLAHPASKKRKIDHKIEEISFDNDARADYLTGFHKRKVQRSKQAQEEAKKKEREERLVMRKQLREERTRDLEQHVEAVNRLLKEANGDVGGINKDSDDEDWNGISDDEEPAEPKVEVLDHEEEYVDEDRYTTVTIEAVNVSRDGMKKAGDDSDSEDEESKAKYAVAKEETGKKVWPKKVRKKKFTYETKTERRLTNAKIKAKTKSKAEARKGNS